jgi:long-chain fatty acid transport protein
MRVSSLCIRTLFLGLMVILLGAQPGYGAGFALYEGSARGNALAQTLVARADDPSAIFYNPAGITQLPGLQVMGGATFILPGVDVQTTSYYTGEKATTSTETNVWVPPHLYATYQFVDSLWFGMGIFGQFGLGTEFDQDWPGRYNNYNAQIKSLTFNPNFAFKVNDQLSLAAGIDFMWFDLKLEQKIDASGQNDPDTYTFDVDQSLTGDTVGVGWNLGLHYKPCNWMALGFSYRSKIRQHVDGDADFKKPDFLDPLPIFLDTGVSGTITLPDTFFTGFMFKPWDRFSVEIGGTYVRWSTYDQLTLDYDSPIAFDPQTGAPIDSVTRIKDWSDTWRASIGFEYTPVDWLDLRAGYSFDESPINSEHVDYLLPANDRHLFSFGPGFRWHNWVLDLSYTYIWITDREYVAARPAEGVLESSFEDGYAHLFGLSVSYKF